GVPVQLVVPADMRARMPIAVPAVVPVVLSGLIPTLVVVVMCARGLSECHQHCGCDQQPHTAHCAPFSRFVIATHRRPPECARNRSKPSVRFPTDRMLRGLT